MSRCCHDMLASLGVIWARPHLGHGENCNTWGNMTIYFCRVLSKDLTTTSDFHLTSLGALCFSSLSHAFSHMTNHPCKFKVDEYLKAQSGRGIATDILILCKFDSLVTIWLFMLNSGAKSGTKISATSHCCPTCRPSPSPFFQCAPRLGGRPGFFHSWGDLCKQGVKECRGCRMKTSEQHNYACKSTGRPKADHDFCILQSIFYLSQYMFD